MTLLKTIAAAALLSALAATPVFAQAAIGEPGAFAFYHPNADVLNGGAPAWAAQPASAYEAQASTVYVPRHLPRHGSHHTNR